MRADRLLALVLLLQSHGKLRAAELADRLEVSVRTVYRDVAALERAGIPVHAETGPGGGISLVEGFRSRLTGLSADEARALAVFAAPRSLADVGLAGSLSTALAKVASSLPAVQGLAAREMEQRLLVDTAPWFRSREEVPYLPALRRAVWESRPVRLHYRRREGEAYERTVDPHALVAKVDRWYLVARSGSELRVFRVSRIEDAEVLDAYFVRQEAFDLPSFWRDWSRRFAGEIPRYEVTFRLDPEGVRRLRLYSRDEALRELEEAPPDDAGRRTLVLDFSREEFALHTLAALGGEVEVLEPSALRGRLRAIGEGLAARHAPGPRPQP